MFNPISNEDPDFQIPMQCIWLKLNGSWPLKTSSKSFFNISYTLWAWYVIGSVGITICFQTAFLTTHFDDIIMITENCCTTLMGALNFVRLLHLRLNQPMFRKIIQQFVDDIWISENTNMNIAKECRNRMTTFKVMTILLSCLILMYCILPVVELFFLVGVDESVKPFPYKMVFPFNPYTSGIRYFFTYIFTAYAGICVVTTLFAEDSIFGFFITYTCGQFRILHESIDNLMMTNAKTVPLKSLHYHQAQNLQRIVQQHNKLICFARRLEDFFNPILLMNLMVSSLLICMVGFQLMTSKNMFIGDYIKFVVYISSSLSQLYILCGNGDTLIQHSTTTAWHLYNCNWESLEGTNPQRTCHNIRIRTSLQLMILCSQRPVKITAFKFSTLSLQSFTAILSTSLSYFTLLRSLYYDNPK